jgi:hypothetical protein
MISLIAAFFPSAMRYIPFSQSEHRGGGFRRL